MTNQRLRKFLPPALGQRTVYPSILSVMLLVIIMSLPALSGAQQTCQPDGDVDRNGSVTAADALLAFQQALSLAQLSACQSRIADVFPLPTTPDGNITASDALCIFQKALSLPSCLDTLPSTNQPPVVNAGADRSVDAGTAVTLSGVATDSDGTITRYAWTQTGGTRVSLAGAATATATFTAPDVPTDETLTFRLTVTDNSGAQASDEVRVTVRRANQPPVVNAGADRSVDAGTAVTLSGVATDSDGTITRYAWTQTGGTRVSLAGAATATATFTAPDVPTDETLTFRLTVTDNSGAQASDEVRVTVRRANQPPVVNAGADRSVDAGTAVTLSGVATDSDGTITRYAWTQTGGTRVSLAGAATATATFTVPDVPTDETLTFRLTVTDNSGAQASDEVRVTVRRANQSPVVNVGADRSVGAGTVVTLSGVASDSDGTITRYAWTQTGGTRVSLAGAATATATFTTPDVPMDETLTFRLTVTDNSGAQASDELRVTVRRANQPPVVNVGVDRSVGAGAVVILSGVATDPDGTIATYTWTQTGGARVSLAGAATATATFTAPDVSADETLTFRLTVTDNSGAQASDELRVTVRRANQPPVADAGFDQFVFANEVVTLAGSGSDADGTIVRYRWVQTSGPPVALSGANTPNASFIAPEVAFENLLEELEFQLTVTDDDGASDTAVVLVVAIYDPGTNEPPTADAGFDQMVSENILVTLSGSASDSDGTVTDYFWLQISGVQVLLFDADTFNPSFTAPEVDSEAELVFELNVLDDELGFAMDTVTITVLNAVSNTPPVANAGRGQTVDANTPVTLSGSGSDADGTIVSYRWRQTSGTPVALSGASTQTASFTAPDVDADEELVFQLTVTDDGGASDVDMVTVTVHAASASSALRAELFENPAPGKPNYVIAGDSASLQYWAAPDGTVRQSLHQSTDGTHRTRVFFNDTTELPRVVLDEVSGNWLSIREQGDSRVDFWAYGSDGNYQGGFAIYEEDGQYYIGEVVGVPAHEGREITGELNPSSGSWSGSFMLTGDPADGLTNIRVLSAEQVMFLESLQPSETSAAIANSPVVAAIDTLREGLFWAGAAVAVIAAIPSAPVWMPLAAGGLLAGALFLPDVKDAVRGSARDIGCESFDEGMCSLVGVHLAHPDSRGPIGGLSATY